jgi:hypothetical protein
MKFAYQAIEARAVPIEKPGKPKKKNLQKQPPPKERHCRYLGYITGSERWCHSESKIHKGGTGIMGGRIPKEKTAWLSDYADKIFSKALPPDATQAELEAHAAEWERLIDLSH